MAVLSEEQRMLRDGAEAWALDRAPVTALRRLREGDGQTGFDPALYAEMAEMGWTGILVPEEFGGSDFGHLSLGLIVERLGRTLLPSPLIDSAVAAVGALVLAGNRDAQERFLPAIASGELVAVLALDEDRRHPQRQVELAAERDGAGWRLSGVKRPVPFGMAAGLFIVPARTADGVALFLVDGSAPGLGRHPLQEVLPRGAAILRFDNVAVGADALLSPPGEGQGVLDRVLDRACICQAAEMLGAAVQAFETTLDYLKTRKQFGRIIGQFQALQHRAANLYAELELTRSAVEAALTALDEGGEDIPVLASLAKALAGDTLRRMATEMIQLHGGIGMTDEHDAGFYLKRARVADMSFGNAAFHRERYARLCGY
ncbi:acyl-CoA dehydrogenase family protein [Niveispirillum sp. KHB5.9]|uniref:acyl-CoA dehydrogenase family protein n=1 Tax=Niveispirillum sp. KHB5.9 TaxID=3400269 RepID=UPI003A8BD5FE